jgi:hypothetical protein
VLWTWEKTALGAAETALGAAETALGAAETALGATETALGAAETVRRQPWELPRQPWELPRQPWELPSQPWELPRQPWELPSQPWELPRQPWELPRQPCCSCSNRLGAYAVGRKALATGSSGALLQPEAALGGWRSAARGRPGSAALLPPPPPPIGSRASPCSRTRTILLKEPQLSKKKVCCGLLWVIFWGYIVQYNNTSKIYILCLAGPVVVGAPPRAYPI